MVEYARENVNALQENPDLLQLQWSEVINDSRRPMDVHWDAFHVLERAEMYALYTARENHRLIGYAQFILNHQLHSRNLIVATTDSIFVHPEFRKHGIGKKLLEFAEQELKEIGVNGMSCSIKPKIDFSPMLKSMGYELEECAYFKLIGVSHG